MATKQILLGSLTALPLSILDEDSYEPRTSFYAPVLEQLTESIMTNSAVVR